MVLDAVLFGIIQGIFEWLPISSQGNLVILMVSMFGYSPSEALSYSIFLHTGTLLAAIVYFRMDILRIIRSLKGYRFGFSPEGSLVSFLILSTIMTGIVGLPLFLYIKTAPVAGEMFIALVGIALIITGLVQIFARKNLKGGGNLNLKDTVILGIAQGLSVIPGISRSGITVSSFLFRKYSSEDAIRFSFLMSIPAVLAAEIGLALLGGLPPVGIEKISIGILFSFVFGVLTIHTLIRAARRIPFWIFCVMIGLIALIPLLFYA